MSKSAIKILDDTYVKVFDDHLEHTLNRYRDEMPARLFDSMSYSLKAGGKRLRPSLCLAVAERNGMPVQSALPLAAAIEFIHTASLIHDDLPCMDDDDLRRGQPTNHKVYGEGLAVVAGDALMLWAFGVCAREMIEVKVPAEFALAAIKHLADGAGPFGMCGGQVLDSDIESRDPTAENFVYSIATLKTAALMRASVTSAAALCGASDEAMRCYADYGLHLGLAFQIVDDVLDVRATSEQLGKTPRKDIAQGKITFASTFGIDQAMALAKDEAESAAFALDPIFPNGDLLIDLAHELVGRAY